MRLVLPYPPTVNLYWRNFRGRTVLSAAGRAYKLAAALKAKSQGAHPISGPVALEIHVYRPRRIGDLDNTLKGLLDSLRGVAYGDDSQVVRLVAHRHDDKANPRAEVTVTLACAPCLSTDVPTPKTQGRAVSGHHTRNSEAVTNPETGGEA